MAEDRKQKLMRDAFVKAVDSWDGRTIKAMELFPQEHPDWWRGKGLDWAVKHMHDMWDTMGGIDAYKRVLDNLSADELKQNGAMLLERAVHYKRADAVEALFNHGLQMSPDELGRRLIVAIAWDDLKTMDLLIEQKANVNFMEPVGARKGSVTPLIWAAEWGRVQGFAKLLNAGADLTQKNNIGETAQSVAIENGRSEIFQMIDFKIKAAISSDPSNAAAVRARYQGVIDPAEIAGTLIKATRQKRYDDVSFILGPDVKFDVNAVNNVFNLTALEVATKQHDDKMVAILKAAGAKPRISP